MAAGRVILLVGTSCAGKSTLTRAIQEAADEPWVALSLDGLFASTPDRWGGSGAARDDGFHYVFEGELRRIGYGPVGWRLLQGFHRAAAAYANAGANVVVDDLLLDGACLADWAGALDGLAATLVRVSAPLAELLRREAARERRRTPGLAAGCLPLHAAVDADLAIDTSLASPAELAARLLAQPLPTGALARLMRRSEEGGRPMDWREHPIRLPETLSDGVLVLDAPTLADAQAHYDGEDDEMRLRFDSRRRATLEEVAGAMQRWMDQRAAGGPQFAYMARLPGAGLIGGCEIRLITPRAANVSYWMYPDHRGKGLAARAMRLLMAAAEGIDGLEVLEAHIAPDNLASRRLAQALGFVAAGETDEESWDGVVSRMLVYERPLARR